MLVDAYDFAGPDLPQIAGSYGSQSARLGSEAVAEQTGPVLLGNLAHAQRTQTVPVANAKNGGAGEDNEGEGTLGEKKSESEGGSEASGVRVCVRACVCVRVSSRSCAFFFLLLPFFSSLLFLFMMRYRRAATGRRRLH